MRIWHCSRCNAAARTGDEKVPMHPCPGMAGLTVPLATQGDRVNMIAVEREDYIGSEVVRLDGNGRPVMAVISRHDDGREDRTVYAPTANVNVRD